jgi:hypothetical protein
MRREDCYGSGTEQLKVSTTSPLNSSTADIGARCPELGLPSGFDPLHHANANTVLGRNFVNAVLALL